MKAFPRSGTIKGTLFFNARHMTVSFYPFAVANDPADGTFVIQENFEVPYTIPAGFNPVLAVTQAARAAELAALEKYHAQVKAIQDALAQFLAIESNETDPELEPFNHADDDVSTERDIKGNF